MRAQDLDLAFLRFGFVLVVLGVVSSCFLLATLQAAYSPYQLTLPSDPFEQLVSESYRLALASFALAYLHPRLAPDRDPRNLRMLLVAGALTKLAVLAFAASQGMMAIQIIDPRVLAPRLFYARSFANLLLLASLVWTLGLVFRRSPSPESSP